MKNKRIRVRFAPSPTGALHIGGVRTALFNYLFAKKNGGDFLLRIEDTDKDRFVAGAEKYIIDSLKWFGITPNEGINSDGTAKYRQSEREYKTYIDILINSGHAYYAFDTKEELEKLRATLMASGANNAGYNCISRGNMKNSFTLSADEVNARISSGNPYVIRFNNPRDKEVKILDMVKGLVTFNSNDMDDKVLFKSDGLPTYHLANVVDDHLMAITHVIRGDEWLPSSPLHIMLYEAFGWDKPEFCHLPLILGPDGQKLSKRHGDKYGFPVFPLTWDYVNEKNENVHITGFREENYEPDALINFLALLGWSPGDEKEIMPLEEMVSLFDLSKINNAGAKFDIDKLKNFNAHYLRNKSSDDLFSFMVPSIKRKDNGDFLMPYSIKNNRKIMDIAKDRSVFKSELYEKVSYFYEPVVLKDDVTLKNSKEFTLVMEVFINEFVDVKKFDIETFKIETITKTWNSESIKNYLEKLCERFDIKIGKIMPDLRMALTGGIPGPHLPEIMEILGKEESFERIKNLIVQDIKNSHLNKKQNLV